MLVNATPSTRTVRLGAPPEAAEPNGFGEQARVRGVPGPARGTDESAAGLPALGLENSATAVRVFDPLASAAWEDWLNRWPSASIFHSSAWMAVLADSYGFKPLALVTPAREVRPAMLPLMECASPLLGRRGVSLPFTDEAPVLADTPTEVHTLLDRALELGRERKWRSLELRGGAGLEDANAAVTFWGHTLNLDRNADGLWARLDDSVRRALRKAARGGVEVRRETTWEAVMQFYRLHCQTRRLHGLPPQPLHFFRNLHRHLVARDAGCLFSAYHQGHAVAAAVFLYRGKRAVYKFGASDKSRQELRANNAVMWEAIQHYAARGFESLDFGRTSCQQAGLRRFKLGWGTRETRIAYWKYDLRRRCFVTVNDRSTGWHTALFRHLPVPVLRWLGARLYPHLT